MFGYWEICRFSLHARRSPLVILERLLAGIKFDYRRRYPIVLCFVYVAPFNVNAKLQKL